MKNKNRLSINPKVKYFILFYLVYANWSLTYGQQEINVKDAVNSNYIDMVVSPINGYRSCEVCITNNTNDYLIINFASSFYFAPRNDKKLLWLIKIGEREPQRLGIVGEKKVKIEPKTKKCEVFETRCLV